MFNSHPRIESIPLFDGHACHVVDDALLEPERVVELAAQHWADAAPAGFNAYPGPELRMPDAVSARLDVFFAEHIRGLLGVRRTERMYSRLAMVTTPPGRLEPQQWICHRDRFNLPPDKCAGASVLYLFTDAALGGTSFFRPRRALPEIEALIEDSASMDRDTFERTHGLPQGYPGASNQWFERVLTVQARWNRMIFYDGSLFHCGDIHDPTLLSDDPRRGRLTLNGFFNCRRVAA